MDFEKKEDVGGKEPMIVAEEASEFVWWDRVSLSSVLLDVYESGGERETKSFLEFCEGVPCERGKERLPLRVGDCGAALLKAPSFPNCCPPKGLEGMA